MNGIFSALITLSVLVAVAVFILVMFEVRAAVRRLNEFLKTTENTLKPTLEELQLSLRSMRGVTDNITAVTDDVKVLTGSVRSVGENVRHVSEIVEEVTSFATVRVSGYRAALRAVIEVLVKGLIAGRTKS
jgi:uncharacterized protein YoxC